MARTVEAMRQEMLEKPVGRLLFEKAHPTVIIQLITVIYNTADTYFVAKINSIPIMRWFRADPEVIEIGSSS